MRHCTSYFEYFQVFFQVPNLYNIHNIILYDNFITNIMNHNFFIKITLQTF